MILKIVIAVIILLAIVCFCLAYGLASFLVHPKLISLEKAKECETRKGYYRNYDELTKEEYLVTMSDGYKLHAVYVPAAIESNKYVIITHGYTYNRLGSVKYLHAFRDLGFHCILFDDRGHGLNEKTICTMGIVEHRDLLELIQDTYARFGEDIMLGLHGESMGSAMTTMALGAKPRVKFAVIDCGYADLLSVTKWKSKQLFHAPGFLTYLASLMCKLCFGYRISEVNPIDALRDNEIPVCFIHGEADDFIHCNHSVRMKEANKGYAELHLIPGADHAESFNTDEERYRKILKEFVEKCA